MMKRKLSLLFLPVLCLLLLIPVPASASAAYLYDGAALYTDEEKSEIDRTFADIESECGLLCVLVTRTESQDTLSLLPTYAGEANDMLLLEIDMGQRHVDLYQYNGTDDEAGYRVSTAESDDILDRVQADLSASDYLTAARDFGKMAKAAFADEQEPEIFDFSDVADDYQYVEYGRNPSRAPAGEILGRIAVGLLIGMAAGGITVLCVVLYYRRKTHGDTYPLKEFSSLTLTDSRDNFSHKTLTVVRKPEPQNNSSGGHGGGHSGGGGSHMGGRSF